MIEFVVDDPLNIICDALLWADDVMQIMAPGGVLDIGREMPEQSLQDAVDNALSQKPVPINHMVLEPHPSLEDASLIRLIVHNFEEYPSTTPAILEKSIMSAIAMVHQQRVKTLAVKPVGMDFGGLSPWEWGVFLGALYRQTDGDTLPFLEHLVIVTEDQQQMQQIEMGFEQSAAIMDLDVAPEEEDELPATPSTKPTDRNSGDT